LINQKTLFLKTQKSLDVNALQIQEIKSLFKPNSKRTHMEDGKEVRETTEESRNDTSSQPQQLRQSAIQSSSDAEEQASNIREQSTLETD
jgi:hypothetical protein